MEVLPRGFCYQNHHHHHHHHLHLHLHHHHYHHYQVSIGFLFPHVTHTGLDDHLLGLEITVNTYRQPHAKTGK
ncbi:hypothetical protein E2C01_004738 [Portunus trituberculatus]|uniref:Uncharacterized protein n=1 Tax=Portunus trituberculatus TaxID=210409 RepID=A0A5B7CT49_PORTR|nr:hypothetical protein [Portunus trituberculatus]